MLPDLSNKEHLILGLLVTHGQLYGLELVKKSEGQLKRGTVYTTLSRMIDKGYLNFSVEENATHSGLPRRKYSLTGHGRKVFEEFNVYAASFVKGFAI
ncbi:PadR family transcriptional regulator [Sulfidibacter corallicola]|uniref:PadR family transcriptional regulator n=1 Tax=Sulfidibacter corallicola TaxID=2818388 RepID=A0A8A4TXH7_SULCO|nr:PadR family transcriptional regulator [Sulfidibacter corallicola]QTD54190.1 PadR family transcriptional regulator [Sulfidibacter corallicola]